MYVSNHLNIGDIVMGKAPNIITTLLGSCVAITMYEPKQQIGGMCHSALPKCPSTEQCSSGCGKAGRYVACAIRVMLKHFSNNQISTNDIQVKLFGGANVLNYESRQCSGLLVGTMNENAALRIVSDHGLRIEAIDTGGKRGRKISFDINTGKVSVSKIGHRNMSFPVR